MASVRRVPWLGNGGSSGGTGVGRRASRRGEYSPTEEAPVGPDLGAVQVPGGVHGDPGVVRVVLIVSSHKGGRKVSFALPPPRCLFYAIDCDRLKNKLKNRTP